MVAWLLFDYVYRFFALELQKEVVLIGFGTVGINTVNGTWFNNRNDHLEEVGVEGPRWVAALIASEFLVRSSVHCVAA